MITSLTGDGSLLMSRNIYFTKCQYLIRCGIILWGGETESVKVLKLYKKVLHGILGLNKRQSCRPVIKFIHWLIKDSLWGVLQKKIKTLIYEGISTCTMREENEISMSKMYNKMPTDINQLECFMDLTQRLKLFLLDHPFYSLN
jgi:hypothetical protein